MAAFNGNTYVTVESTTQGVEDIYSIRDDFYVTTRNVSAPSFVADVKVTANYPYRLTKPGSGHLHLRIGESDTYKVSDGAGSEDAAGGAVCVLKLDIEQAETNVCWKTTSCTLRLTRDSFPGGEATWTSAPAGISGSGSSVTFNPSSLTPGEYVVTAASGIVSAYVDTCIVRIVSSGFRIFVDQPGAGGDRDAYEWIGLTCDVGHTFWMYTNSYPTIVEDSTLRFFLNTTMGYYPVSGASLTSPSDRGRVRIPDDEHLAGHEVDHYWDISLTQLLNGLMFSQQLMANPGTYDLNTNNCTDAAIGAGAAVGISVPDTQGTWPFGGGSNPGDLGEDLRLLNNNNH